MKGGLKDVPLSAGKPFSSLFPNVVLKDRAELSVNDQQDSGFPRYDGDPEALLSFASTGVLIYTIGSRCLSAGSNNEASKVLEFTPLVQFAAQLAKANEATEVSGADLVTMGEQILQGEEDEPRVGSNHSSPDKQKTEASAFPVTPKPEQAGPSKAQGGREPGEISVADSRKDMGTDVLHEYKYGRLLKELSERNHTELVIRKRRPDGKRVFRGALELSKNLLDQKNYKQKKEQVPTTAVVLNLANFDQGIMNRRTYVISADGNMGYACCFIPAMDGVNWVPGKMKSKDVVGTIVFANTFQLFNKVAKDRQLPFEATKSTLYGLEVIARLCAPELLTVADKAQFWEHLREHAEADLQTAVRVLEPMFQKPAFYDGLTFKDGKLLPEALTSFGNELRARACATGQLRELAQYYNQLSTTLMEIVKEREHKEAEDQKLSMTQYLDSMGDEELAHIQEMIESRKRRKVSGDMDPSAKP